MQQTFFKQQISIILQKIAINYPKNYQK